MNCKKLNQVNVKNVLIKGGLGFLSVLLFLLAADVGCQEKENLIGDVSSFNESQSVSSRLHNIHLMRNVLQMGQYQGYDIIIVSSTTEEESDYHQKMLQRAFEGTSKTDGSTPLILSVVDTADGGQILGAIFTWIKAEEKIFDLYHDKIEGYASLIDYIRAKKYKVAVYHNGGKGERCSPLTQSLGNSRGAQKLVGSIINAKGEEIELDLLLGVILQCSDFARTNCGSHVDTFWTSQIAFGSKPHDQSIRSNFGLDKFLVGFNKDNLIAQNIADFGTAALSKNGRMIAFYGNKRFAYRKGGIYTIDSCRIEKELFAQGDRFAYDFGSFSISLDMWDLLIKYWKVKGVFDHLLAKSSHRSEIKRDIDPHFIQPFIRFLYALNDIADRKAVDEKLPLPSSLLTISDILQAREKFSAIMQTTMPEAYAYIWEDINQEADAKKKSEAIICLNEIIEFYLMYRQEPVFLDLKKVFGFVDLGDDTQWFRYRRPIDIMNEKFDMLVDLIEEKIETQLNGETQKFKVEEKHFQRSREARMMRGISEKECAKFSVEGKPIVLSIEEVKVGKMVEGVFVKNSIIQHCDLTKGSCIENCVVNHSSGKILANDSYIESSTSPLIISKASMIHQVIDMNMIKADREVVSDVFKSSLSPAYHGRMRAPIGYDPKGMPIYKIAKTAQDFDETIRYFIERLPYSLEGAQFYCDKTAKTDDGRFTFEEIREIEPKGASDRKFMERVNLSVKKEIEKERLK